LQDYIQLYNLGLTQDKSSFKSLILQVENLM